MSSLTCTQSNWDDLSGNRKEMEHIITSFLTPIGVQMIAALCLKEDFTVLDVATGTGEPGLSAAKKLLKGKVTGVDISEKMLQIASNNAALRKIHNFETLCSDAAQMPFPDHSFDAVMCRNGVMFFTDIAAGLREMQRVLRPGGKMAVSTWCMLEKNLWTAIVLEAIGEITRKKVYKQNLPGMFHCTQPGFMSDWFDEINMEEIREQELTGIVAFNSPDEHWNYVTTVSAAVINALKGTDHTEREMIRQVVKEKILNHLVNDKLYFQWAARITIGTKAAFTFDTTGYCSDQYSNP